MEKLKMHTPDLTQDNVARIRELFPSCVTEAKDAQGNIKYAIDFDQLRQELSSQIVEGQQERYQLNWPGKREALLTANAPIAKTLRPAREESVDFDTTKNLFIEGDNLDALKLLQETYLGKIKIIYIDPPYNTGNDFVYEDDFAEDSESFFLRSNQKDEQGNRLVTNTSANGRFHSDWLSMMYSRLKLARNLLKEDGLIFISVDEIENSNLRKICNEVFGEDNFFTEIIWKNKTGGGAKSKGWIGLHEYVLCYARNAAIIENISIPYSEKTASMYNKKDEHFQTRGHYATWPLDTTSMGDRPNLKFAIPYKGKEIWPEKQWLWSKERVDDAIAKNMLEFNLQADGTYKVRFKGYLKDESGVVRRGSPLSVMDGPYSQDGSKDFQALLPKTIFPFPKPTKLLAYLFSIRTSDHSTEGDEDIILDFFAGSATTAHAVIAQNSEDGGNRKFIMVQIPEKTDESSEAYKAGFLTISEIAKERIRRAGKKIMSENALFKGDIGFRVLKLDTSNMADIYYIPDNVEQKKLLDAVNNIKPDRNNPEDLLFQVLLDWGVDLSLPIRKEKIQGKNIFFVDENALVACFDTNVSEDLVKELTGKKPLRVVFRDNGFESDAVKINVDQIFKQLSPYTEVKSI